MDILFSELKKKDVIDVCSGKKLGKISDVKFDFPFGKIKSFSVRGGLFCEEVIVLLSQIERVGEDTVLVNLTAKDGVCDNPPDSKGEKGDFKPDFKPDLKPPHNPCKPDCRPNRKPDCSPCKPIRPNPRDLHFDEDE